MTSLGLVKDVLAASEAPRIIALPEAVRDAALPRGDSVYEEQIHALVQQLFLRQSPALVRHVGFAALEPDKEIAPMCLDVARALAESGLYDVGLIDARLQSVPLELELQIPTGNDADASWMIGPRLRLARRQSWLDENPQRVWEPSLARLRTAAMEFDFSILCFDPASWLTARMGQACHGLVMVLTANKTRRLVAAQMQEQLHRARVPLLGTVLAERRFPVPPSLYRKL
jgi:Mrp family chromosome partitioning ATPase